MAYKVGDKVLGGVVTKAVGSSEGVELHVLIPHDAVPAEPVAEVKADAPAEPAKPAAKPAAKAVDGAAVRK